MSLLLNNLTPLPWAIAGAGIALVTLTLLFLTNTRLGISSGFDDMCGLVLAQPYLRKPGHLSARRRRLPFLFGLLLGGVLSAVVGGGWKPMWTLGMFDDVIGLGRVGKLAWMFAGGLFIGFGTRLAGGCTSGHGIFGLANLELPSMVATASFMGAGIVTTQLIYHFLFA